jgi:arylmalonate decarboxylase
VGEDARTVTSGAFQARVASAASARIALLVPPAKAEVPPETALIAPAEAHLEAVGLGLGRLEADAYSVAADCALQVAAQLSSRPPDALSLMGTSLSFFAGAEKEESLRARLGQLAGCPSTTMAAAVLRALKAVGCKRPAVVTAYTEPVNEALVGFLESYGVDPGPVVGLQFTDPIAVESVATDTLVSTAHKALSATSGADGILISCGGLRTMEAVVLLEQETGFPVVSSSLAGPWDVLGLAGLATSVNQKTRLLETQWSPEL